MLLKDNLKLLTFMFFACYSRQWVMVNAKRIFVSQRQIPKMALIQPSFEGENYLCLDAPGMPRVKINVDAEDGERNKEFIK